MRKEALFLKLYRKKMPENIIIFLLFTLLAAAISMVLFVQKNNTYLFQSQMEQAGFADHVEFAYQSAENILGIIAAAAVFIGAAGGVILIGFRNKASEKSIVMMHIFGMGKKDLAVKALLDAAVYAFMSSLSGYVGGYLLFLHFALKILKTEISLTFFSTSGVTVFCTTLGLIAFLLFFGNLSIDFRMAEKPAVEALYQRKGRGEGHGARYVLAAELCGILLFSLLVFHLKKKHLFVIGLLAGLLSAFLFAVFHFIFGVYTKKHRKNKKICSVIDLSFCFLCSRNQRDALLSIVISIGTIFLCFAANVGFNIGDMLRSAYRDNMGYTALIRVDEFEQKEQVKSCLDEQGIPYTFGYSKLMNYSQLYHMDGEEGKFRALVIEKQTDNNLHFYVPENSILVENYFASRCNIEEGKKTDSFGSSVECIGYLTDNQYLSLVNYNFIINKADWNLDIDDSWSAVFLTDLSAGKEQKVEKMLESLPCHMESASKLIDELKQMMSDYLDILILVVGMIMLVTSAIFYTVIRSDLTGRRTEMYLYRVFGASFAKAQKVIFYEYMMIAFISSFAVSFTVMVCGEIYFYFGLRKHFPMSLPITAATTLSAVIFIVLCCQAAGLSNARSARVEVIRDE